MKKSVILLSISLIILSSCVGRFNYQPNITQQDNKYDYSVAVENFTDNRPEIGGTGKMWLSYIPLVPYGWGYYNKPENGNMFFSITKFNFSPENELAIASEQALKHSKLFSKVTYINKLTDEKYSYIFTGSINSTLFEEKMFTYCFSLYGPLLWFLGAPAGWTSNTLNITFYLKDASTGKILWEDNEEGYDSSLHWFYYRGQDVSMYDDIFNEIAQRAIDKLSKFLNSNETAPKT